MTYLKILKYLGPFIVGGLIFGGAAWKYKDTQLDACRKDNKVCLTEKEVCMSANAENVAMIDALKAEIAKGNRSCESRLKSKDAVIKRLKIIDDLALENKNEVDDSDPIMSELNRMW